MTEKKYLYATNKYYTPAGYYPILEEIEIVKETEKTITLITWSKCIGKKILNKVWDRNIIFYNRTDAIKHRIAQDQERRANLSREIESLTDRIAKYNELLETQEAKP